MKFLFPLLLAFSSNALAAPVDFERDVRPILRGCLKCHGAEKQESNLRLDRRASLLRGGDRGEPTLVPGKAEKSFLIRIVSGKEPDITMPPEGDGLSKKSIETLIAWIDQGAKMPAALSGEVRNDHGKHHWSFQPIWANQPPASESEFVANPIDAFIERKLDEKKLRPSERADRRTLIRRLYFVMHGLPPSPEQIQRFLNDDAPDAWRRLVDEVLESPRYGERWARHWLDVIRFGETHGFETNRERSSAWPFRDYVIESLNDDKPYDQFVREQIAGDAIGEPVGTGFLVAGPYDLVKGGGNLAAIQRMNELDDMINASGTTFLGLTLGCARCHNHKFDPVTQTDYYAIQAVFAGVGHGDRVLPNPPRVKDEIAELEQEVAGLTERLTAFLPPGATAKTRPAVDPRHNVESFTPREAKFVRFTIEQTNGGQPCIDELQIFSGKQNLALAAGGAKATSSGDFQHPLHKLSHINDGKFGNSRSWIAAKQQGGWVQIEFPRTAKIDRIEWGRDRDGKYKDRLAVAYRVEAAVSPGQWELIAGSKDRKPFGGQPAKPTYDFSKGSPSEIAQGRQWLARVEHAQKEIARLRSTQRVYAGVFTQPGVTHRLYRGEPDQKREPVGPNAVAFLTSLNLKADAPERQRRLAFANWIAGKQNPLTARVIVNRLWQHHFGVGLVTTPNDFGMNGQPPTHPALLDWLATELMKNGWSLKHMHRLMLTSNTWQQDSRPRENAVAADASSRWLWRFPPRRLEAEAIRDGMLAVSGVLDLRMGGPGFSGFRVDPENVRHYFPKQKYGPEDWRRMIYMTKVRQEQESVFGAFDCPDASQTAPKRSRSTTPVQALNLYNSQFVLQQAGLFSKRLERAVPAADTKRVSFAYELAFGRPATPAEAREGLDFATKHGWRAFCRAILNANEFLFIP